MIGGQVELCNSGLSDVNELTSRFDVFLVWTYCYNCSRPLIFLTIHDNDANDSDQPAGTTMV